MELAPVLLLHCKVLAPTPRALLEGSSADGAWDHEVGGPCAVPMAGGRYRLYYSGRPAAGPSGTSTGDESSGSSGGSSSSGSESNGGSSDNGGTTSSGSGSAWQGFGLALTSKDEVEGAQRFEGLRTDFERLSK